MGTVPFSVAVLKLVLTPTSFGPQAVSPSSMTNVNFDRTGLVQPPKSVSDFLARLDREGDDDAERRELPRRPIVIEVAIFPVDSAHRQCGESFLAISKDVSASGMVLIHTRAVNSGNVVVEIVNRDNESVRLLARVVRCQATTRFYEIGLQFVSRLAGR